MSNGAVVCIFICCFYILYVIIERVFVIAISIGDYAMYRSCERCDNPMRQHQMVIRGNVQFVWRCLICGKEHDLSDRKESHRGEDLPNLRA